MFKAIRAAAVILTAALACGCSDLSNRTLPDEEPTEPFSGQGVTFSAADTYDEDRAAGEIYSEYPFTPENEEFLSRTVFVGGNLCLGLGAYGIVTSGQVIADENITADNITDISVSYGGGRIDVLTALVNANPSHIAVSLGPKHTKSGDPDNSEQYSDADLDGYIQKYMEFITLAENYCPDAGFIVLAAPPAGSASAYSAEAIDEYNTALKKAVEELNNPKVKFTDIGIELKNSNGELKSNYDTGDSLSLTERGYHAVLWQICNY